MKRLLPVLMVFGVFLGSAGESFAEDTEGGSVSNLEGGSVSNLPPCPKNQKQRYHNCFGTRTFSGGSKYIGEWKNGKWNGQGAYTYANGVVEEGIWENGRLFRSQKVNLPVTT